MATHPNVDPIERVEVVDAEGAVVGVVTRAEMRARNLRHRSVGVVVRRPGDGAVLAHRRAAWKDVWPGRWDIAFGGVCSVGESAVETAVRELAEEAGVEIEAAQLRPLGSNTYDDEHVSAIATMFEVVHQGPFSFPDGEVEEIAWVPFAELGWFLDEHPHCPDSAAVGLPLLRP